MNSLKITIEWLPKGVLLGALWVPLFVSLFSVSSSGSL